MIETNESQKLLKGDFLMDVSSFLRLWETRRAYKLFLV